MAQKDIDTRTAEMEEVENAINSLNTPTASEEAGIPKSEDSTTAVHPESPPKSGEVPTVEESSRSGGNTSPPDENKKPRKKSDPDGPIAKEQAPNKKTTSVTKAMASKFGKVGKLGLLLNGGLAVANYSGYRSEGDTATEAAIKTVGEAAITSVIGPGKFLAGMALAQVPGMASDAFNEINSRTRELNRLGTMRPFEGNTFVDNPQIFTMRQASMVVMQQSKYNLEHAMQGNEASYLHR
ncbi:hypothetical protein [Heyndrickxia sporothermodurans]|jgi:hypothetical protein|uniref:hypothetical protein n=1 Tax=Heyndrickxia sporothermodurans TaxID=46224 RepID=UPI000D3604A9|nr:hypothetical protein [Heyndrickxia sporothermodurans]PTY92903.1 hypothetical protein B5V90_02155 [Heyndrickxia sporothermodurans]